MHNCPYGIKRPRGQRGTIHLHPEWDWANPEARGDGLRWFYTIIIFFGRDEQLYSRTNRRKRSRYVVGECFSHENRRHGKGRTLLLALQVPELSEEYMRYLLPSHNQQRYTTIQGNTDMLNTTIGAYNESSKGFIGIGVDISVPHNMDDGLHFSSSGYSNMATRIANAIIEELK